MRRKEMEEEEKMMMKENQHTYIEDETADGHILNDGAANLDL